METIAFTRVNMKLKAFSNEFVKIIGAWLNNKLYMLRPFGTEEIWKIQLILFSETRKELKLFLNLESKLVTVTSVA
jgi:hypothetical protein